MIKKPTIISVNPQLYPLEAIYNACYMFLDKAYIFLDGDSKKKINIRLKLKPSSDKQYKNNQELKEEFLNELLNAGLRYQISSNNRELREHIVSSALMGALQKSDIYDKLENAVELAEAKEQEEDSKEGKFEDPLGIATPWEEKFKAEKKKSKKRKK